MDRITLAHGSGGIETWEILRKLLFTKIEEELKRIEGGIGIDELDDGATIPLPNGNHIIITTDSYTVNPPFFPGGNIGKLAIAGSINDVLMMGGKPIAILDSIIIEEGYPIKKLEEIITSLIETARNEKIAIIGGDFKVMPKGQIDKIVINTTAIGITEKPIIDKPKPGDKIITSGYLGDHGATIMLMQMELEEEIEEIIKGELKSDVKPLTKLMQPLIKEYREEINAARDPTRGGLAGVINEWTKKTGLTAIINEIEIPIRKCVKRYSEMLGIDPLYLASEGTAIISVKPEKAEEILEYIKKNGFKEAKIIGEFKENTNFNGYVIAKTAIGGYRIIEPPHGEIIPRIC